jgi:septal ring factor EnvC (AmiA/AmiB activator)
MLYLQKPIVFVCCIYRNLKKAQEKVKTAGEDIEENKNKIEELQKQLETLESDATTVIKAYKEAQVCVYTCRLFLPVTGVCIYL